MASLLNTYPGWKKWLDNPDYGRDMTPEQRKLKFWPTYQALLKAHPEYKNAVSAEDFINDPYASFKSLDTFVQGGVTPGTAAGDLASVDLAFPTNSRDFPAWVKKVTDAGKNPYDLLTPAQQATYGLMDSIEGTLYNLSPALAQKYVMPSGVKYAGRDEVSGPGGTGPGGIDSTNPDENRANNPILGYDKDGKPVTLADQINGATVVYKTKEEFAASQAENRGINPIIGYDKDGNPVQMYGPNKNPVVYKTQAAVDIAKASGVIGNTNPDLAAGKPRGEIIGYSKQGEPLYAGSESQIAYKTYDDYAKAIDPNYDPNKPIGYDKDGKPVMPGAGNQGLVVYQTQADYETAKAGQTYKDDSSNATGAHQSLNDASWYYGTGADFAKYSNPNFPGASEQQGGLTWKPGVILGQEAQNRYLAGDQFMQWLPGAFQQAIAATPQSVPTPTWSSYSQGLTGPGNWAAGYPQNIKVGGRASDTGQTQTQTQTQGQQFSPYNMTAPYGFPQQQYNKTQQQTPWYQGLGGTPTQAGATLAGTQQGTQTNPTLAGTDQTQGGPSLAADKQKAPGNVAPTGGIEMSNRSQMYTPQGVNNQQAGLPQTYAGAFADVGNQALGNNQYGSTVNQLRGLANPNTYTTPTETYGAQGLRTQGQDYATSPIQNPGQSPGAYTYRDSQGKLQIFNPNPYERPAQLTGAGRALGTEGQVSDVVTKQLNKDVTTNPLYQQAQNKLNSQLVAPDLTGQITNAMAGNLNPQLSDVYNKQLSDTLYADQTRRLDEDYTKQLQDTKDYYNFYGLSGSSAENQAMEQMKQKVDRQKGDIRNTIDAQMIQKAQALQGNQLGNLTNALSGVSGAQTQGINSAMGLMDLPQAQQRAAAGLGLGLLGQQQGGANDEFSRLMASLNEATGTRGQEANISLGAAGQNLANTGQQAGILGNLSQLGMQGYGAGSDTSQWLTNYFDQLSQTQRANAAQDYTMAQQESATQQQAQQQNYQNLLQQLGIGTGLYDTFGTQGWNQMNTVASNLANIGAGWTQAAAQNTNENNWWQPLLGGAAQGVGAAYGGR